MKILNTKQLVLFIVITLLLLTTTLVYASDNNTDKHSITKKTLKDNYDIAKTSTKTEKVNKITNTTKKKNGIKSNNNTAKQSINKIKTTKNKKTATERTVNNFAELDEAVTWFNENQETGTITLSGDEVYQVENSKVLLIDTSITINGQGRNISNMGNSQTRIIHVNNEKILTVNDLNFDNNLVSEATIFNEGNLTLDNVKITNTVNPSQASGIRNDGNLTITNSEFNNNSNTQDSRVTAGVIYSRGGNVKIEKTVFKNCYSYNDAGVITFGTAESHLKHQNVKIKECVFENNYANRSKIYGLSEGGAIVISDDSNVWIDNCTFRNNSAIYGGAILVKEYNNVSINDTVFEENNAVYGGAIHYDRGSDNGYLNVTNSTFRYNNGNYSDLINRNYQIDTRGGAISSFSSINLLISNNQFIGQTATGGGAIYLEDGNASVKENFFKNNYVEEKDGLGKGYGGAIYILRTTLNLEKNNITGGHAIIGDAITNNKGSITSKNNRIYNVSHQGGCVLYNYGTFESEGDIIEFCTEENIFIQHHTYTCTIKNAYIHNNTALEVGGAFVNYGILNISNSNITGNRAPQASAIYNLATLTLNNVKLLDNQAHANEFDDISLTQDSSNNKLILKAGFKGYDNQLNSIWNEGGTISVTDVTYLDANGVNIISGDIRTSDYEEGINITVEAYDKDNLLLFNKSVKTDKDGYFECECPYTVSSEAYAFKFYHIEDNYYTFLEDSIVRNISYAKIDVSNIYYKDDQIIKVHVSSINPELIDLLTGNVNVTLTMNNSGVLKNITLDPNQYPLDDDKNVTITISGLNVSNYTISIRYNGDAYHLPVIASADIEVYKIASKVNISIDDYVYGNDAYMKINIYEVNNIYPGNVSVTITSAKVNAEGKVDFNHTWTFENVNENSFKRLIDELLDAGEYNVSIYFSGTNNYLNNTNKSTFKVNKTNVAIDIKADNVTCMDNSNIDVTILSKTTTGKINITILDENQKVILKYADIDLKDAHANKIIDKLEPGNYEVRVNYSGDKNHNNNSNTSTFVVRKVETNLSLDKINTAFTNCAVNITGKLTYGNTPIGNAKIKVKVNDESFETTTNNKGEFSIKYTPKKEGDYSVEAKYDGNKQFNPSDNKTSFKAKNSKIYLSLYPIGNTTIGKKVKIRGQLYYENNKGLPNANITLKINKKTVTVKTDDNGNFELEYEVDKTGLNNVTARYDKNSSVSNHTQFYAAKKNVIIKVDPITSTVGEQMNFVAYITDKNGNKVTGGNLAFKINDITLKTNKKFKENKLGAYKFNVTNGLVTYNCKTELYLRNAVNVSASYSGSEQYNSAKSKISKVKIKLRRAKLSISTVKVAKQNTYITFKVKVTDVTPNSKKNLVNKDGYVIFKINGKTLKKNSKVIKCKVKNNVVNYKYHIPRAMAGVFNNKKIRDYNISAEYFSKLYYQDKNRKNSTIFHVKRSPININYDKVIYNSKKQQIKINANITDYQHKLVKGKNKICLKINGKTLKNKNKTQYYYINNGKINLTIKYADKNKIKNLTIVTGDRQAYLSNKSTTKKIKTI